jgi:hypothetical protein
MVSGEGRQADGADYNRRMSRSTTKKKRPAPRGAAQPPISPSRSAAASRLQQQTRKQLGKHYRAKYGVK